MPHTTMPTTRLEMSWTPVVDDRGRTRMEVRWVETAVVAPTSASSTTSPGLPVPASAPAPRPVPAIAGHAA